MTPIHWLWLAVALLAWRVFRRDPPTGEALLGRSPETGDLYVGQIGHNITVEEITQLVPQRAVMAYFISRYPQPPNPPSRSGMPPNVGGVYAADVEGVNVIIDVTNYRILDEGGVLKVAGWAIWTWQLPGKAQFYGWRAKLHPVDYALAKKLEMVGANI